MFLSGCSASSGTETGDGGRGGVANASGGMQSSGAGGTSFAQGGSSVAKGGSTPGGAGSGGSPAGGSGTKSGGGSGNQAGQGGQGGSANRGGGTSAGGGPTGGAMAAGGRSAGGTTAGGTTAGGTTAGGSAGANTVGGAITQPSDPCAPRAGYRNLFAELLSKSEAEIDAKFDAAFQQLFKGSSSEKVYYESGSDEAYILDVNNNDVRTEGMSYGMMITVHMDKKAEFNRLWKWARTHMYQAGSGYFGWQASSSGQLRSTGSAPDGEEYFVTALILASKRWGDGSGIFAYSTEAKNLLTALATKGDFDAGSHLVTFGVGTGYSDPSYVLPAFYEMWACFDSKNAAFFKSAVTAGRQFFPKNVNSTTSLCSYLANFNGSPHSNGPDFNSDSWRCVGNIMMDHHLFHADPWQATFAKNYAAFFKTQLALRPMPDEYRLNGGVKVTHDDPAKGLIAQHALVAFGVPASEGTLFVQALWDLPIPSGNYRYYDAMLYMLSFLHVSGRFRIY